MKPYSTVRCYVPEFGEYRAGRSTYICPFCESDGCLDSFPPESPRTIDAGAEEFRHELHCACSGGRVFLVVPFSGFDAPYIEAWDK